MDDRAKIVQYFTRPVNGAGDIAGAVESIKIEEMFGKCWGVPCQVFISILKIKVTFYRDFYLISVFCVICRAQHYLQLLLYRHPQA